MKSQTFPSLLALLGTASMAIAAQPFDWPQSKEGPSATPTVDGDRRYVMGLAGNVVCLHTADGKVAWQRNLTADFGGRSPMWSFRESPLVDGDHVICTPGGEETTIVALNKLNGQTVWKGFAPDRAGGGGPQNRGPGGVWQPCGSSTAPCCSRSAWIGR